MPKAKPTRAEIARVVELVAQYGDNRQAAADAYGEEIGRHFAASNVKTWLRFHERGVCRETDEAVVDEEGQGEVTAQDRVDAKRLRDQLSALKAERDDLARHIVEQDDIRAHLLGLPPAKVGRIGPPDKPHKDGSRSVILHLSDIQYAEVIDLEELDGLNSFSVAIADARLDRLFNTTSALLTKHWSGDPPQRVHLCLGGDMVSGGIHEELAITDELGRIPSALQVAGKIAAGVRLIRSRVKCPVTIYSVPGNHGRLTKKPTHKGAAVDNLDTLVAATVEMLLKDDEGISVSYGASVDCLFSVYGFDWLLTHGDRMGSRGGTGFLGSAATILRGHYKLYSDYSRRGTPFYRCLTAHFHTTLRLPLGYANGSVPGWSDYARDLRADREPPQQNMLVVHSDLGVINHHEIYLGHPDEGSMYR